MTINLTKLKHKIKYNIPTKFMLPNKLSNYIKSAFILTLILITIITQIASGYTLVSSGAQPNKIFKCQPSTISGNFTGAVTSANVWINSSAPVMWNGTFQSNQTRLLLTNNGGGYWTATYGNNWSILYGNRTLTFEVTDVNGVHYNTTTTWLFVYSDTCTGTGITNYTQVNTGFRGFGNYTSRLWTNPDYTLIDLSLAPWIDYWGYFFYLFIVGLAASSVYQKSQLIWQPILVAVTGLGVLASTTSIPDDFRNWIILILGISFGGIIYKITQGR